MERQSGLSGQRRQMRWALRQAGSQPKINIALSANHRLSPPFQNEASPERKFSNQCNQDFLRWRKELTEKR